MREQGRLWGARRMRRGGFTLIELGIVIAVIAVLATVVLFGRGFIGTAKVTKAKEALDIIRKAGSAYTGARGGGLDTTETGAYGYGCKMFFERGLIPKDCGLTANHNWPTGDIYIHQIRFKSVLGAGNLKHNYIAVSAHGNQMTHLEDIYNGYMETEANNAFINDSTETTAVGLGCTVDSTGKTMGSANSGDATYCFEL